MKKRKINKNSLFLDDNVNVVASRSSECDVSLDKPLAEETETNRIWEIIAAHDYGEIIDNDDRVLTKEPSTIPIILRGIFSSPIMNFRKERTCYKL